MSMGDNIKKYRKLKGLTQRQLADSIGAKHNSVCDWEKGKSKPDVDTVELICGTLGINPAQLLGMENEPKKQDELNEGFNEAILIKKYSQLDVGHQKAVFNLINNLLEYQEYNPNK